jgi:hypothetical protein
MLRSQGFFTVEHTNVAGTVTVCMVTAGIERLPCRDAHQITTSGFASQSGIDRATNELAPTNTGEQELLSLTTSNRALATRAHISQQVIGEPV